ncbi:fumarylacetoacetate hydrolase family protein [Streptomyces niveus]|uniref:fumarylacetoacetate hydrolase family protein n=1 Tax=Streptomyces niveus TaxID=193462 RepID=UPI0036CF5891
MFHDDRTRDLIFSVPEPIAQISAVLPLLPSDIVFTGTRPGWARPEIRSCLTPGTTPVSTVETLGTPANRLVAAPPDVT